jgi:hypothetical protein
MTMSHVGFWRGLSALVGLIGTFGCKVSARHLDVVSTGMGVYYINSYVFRLVWHPCSSKIKQFQS